MSWNKGLTKETDPRVRSYGEKSSKTQKGRSQPEGYIHSLKTKQIISEAVLSQWKDPEIAKKRFKNRKINKDEIFVDFIIQTTCLGELKYTGDGKIWIAGKCPDWFNVNNLGY